MQRAALQWAALRLTLNSRQQPSHVKGASDYAVRTRTQLPYSRTEA